MLARIDHVKSEAAKRCLPAYSCDDWSGEDTPPLVPRDCSPQPGAATSCRELALVRTPPPPPPPPPAPPKWVEAENLVMEALRRKDPGLPAGWPALVAAAYEDEADAVQWLLEARSNPNDSSSSRASPLWHAVANGNAPMVSMLLQARADPNHKKKNSKGAWRSVLDMAVNDCAPEEIVAELRRAGAMPGRGQPPFLRAASSRLSLKDLEPRLALPPLQALALGPQLALKGEAEAELAGGLGPHAETSREGGRGAGAEEAGRAQLLKALEALRDEASDTEAEEPAEGTDHCAAGTGLSPGTPPLRPGEPVPLSAPAPLPEQEPPAMQLGSAYAARSAFRKAYSKQLLPLCDEKPVLDFSVYSGGKQAPESLPRGARRYAGLVIRGGPRGSDVQAELGRARIAREVQLAAEAEAAAEAAQLRGRLRGSASSASAPGGAVRCKVEQEAAVAGVLRAYGDAKPDIFEDPWGCALAVVAAGDRAADAAGPSAPALVSWGPIGPGERSAAAAAAAPKRMPGPRPPSSPPPAALIARQQEAQAQQQKEAVPATPPPAPAANGDAAAGGVAPPTQLPGQGPPRPPHSAGLGTLQGAALKAELGPGTPPIGEGPAASSSAPPISFSKAAAAAAALPKAAPPASAAAAGFEAPSASGAPGPCLGPCLDDEQQLATASAAAAAAGDSMLLLPRMADHDLPEMPRQAAGAYGETGTAVQWSIIKELAGGARFHDPARDAWAAGEQAGNANLIDVKCLRFCHETISPNFMHGEHRGMPVLSLLEALHAGRVVPARLPPLVVMKTESGLHVVCGNRRLYCLKRYAAEASKTVSAWCIVYNLKAQETPRALVMKYILAMTTKDGGSIKLRGR